MKHNERLVKGSFYLTLENLSNTILGAVFWAVMAKLVEPSVLGQVMVVIAFATTIIGFSGEGARTMVSKYISEFIAKDKRHLVRDILTLGVRLALVISGIAVVAIIILSDSIAKYVYNSIEIAPFLIFTAIGFIPLRTLGITLQGAFEGAQKMQYSLLITLLFQSIRLVSALILIAYGLSALGIIAAFAAGSSIAALIDYYFMLRILPKVKGEKEDLRYAIGFSGWNYVNRGMNTLTLQIGVIILGTQSFEFAAFYGISTIISRMVGGFALSISRTVLPIASAEYAKGSKENVKSLFSTSLRMSLVISGLALVVFISNPSYILSLLSESYTIASRALNLLIIDAFVNAFALQFIAMLNALGHASNVAIRGIISAIITIILTIILVPILSLEGAAIAMLVGSLASLSLSIILLWKRESIIPSINYVSRPIISIISTIFIIYLISTLFSLQVLLTFALVTLLYAGSSLGFRATTLKEILLLLSILRKRV